MRYLDDAVRTLEKINKWIDRSIFREERRIFYGTINEIISRTPWYSISGPVFCMDEYEIVGDDSNTYLCPITKGAEKGKVGDRVKIEMCWPIRKTVPEGEIIRPFFYPVLEVLGDNDG